MDELLSALAGKPPEQIASLKGLDRDIQSLTGWSRDSVDVASAVLSHVDRLDRRLTEAQRQRIDALKP